MKIVFLDVDGELTYSNYENIETSHIDIEKVKLLKEICDKTDAKVVVISSWRGTEKHTPKIYYILRDILDKFNIPVIGDAPCINVQFENNKVKHGTGRAAEVKQWLKEHPETESYVILDDDDWDWVDYNMDKNWIRPTWFGDGGLKQEHVEEAIKILNETK